MCARPKGKLPPGRVMALLQGRLGVPKKLSEKFCDSSCLYPALNHESRMGLREAVSGRPAQKLSVGRQGLKHPWGHALRSNTERAGLPTASQRPTRDSWSIVYQWNVCPPQGEVATGKSDGAASGTLGGLAKVGQTMPTQHPPIRRPHMKGSGHFQRDGGVALGR